MEFAFQAIVGGQQCSVEEYSICELLFLPDPHLNVLTCRPNGSMWVDDITQDRHTSRD